MLTYIILLPLLFTSVLEVKTVKTMYGGENVPKSPKKRLQTVLARELDRLVSDSTSSHKSSELYLENLSVFAETLEQKASDIRSITIPTERSMMRKDAS